MGWAGWNTASKWTGHSKRELVQYKPESEREGSPEQQEGVTDSGPDARAVSGRAQGTVQRGDRSCETGQTGIHAHVNARFSREHGRRLTAGAKRYQIRIGGVRLTDKIAYREPLYVWAWLDTALKKEWQKYAATPVTSDMFPGHELAQAWGYVVAGYFLIEQGLKAVLHVRGVEPPKTHALSVLSAELPAKDQDVLRAYYDDFRHTFPGMSSFPLATLDEFLVNLDGAQNSRGHYIGSYDWRYFLTEEGSGASMPRVGINVMHEVVYGCVQLVRSIDKGDDKAGRVTYSWRLRWKRSDLYQDWLTVRMNSPGWGQEGDRLEILWGPGYGNRFDYMVIEGGRIRSFFAPLPNEDEVELAMIDKRGELESFDPKEGFRSIGVTMSRQARRREPASGHVMY